MKSEHSEHSGLICFFDQSGGNEGYDNEEIYSLLPLEKEFDFCMFDTEVHEVHTSKLSAMDTTFDPFEYRSRCGGTDFEPVIDFCNSFDAGEYTTVFIFTDGYGSRGRNKYFPRELDVSWFVDSTGMVDFIMLRLGKNETFMKL